MRGRIGADWQGQLGDANQAALLRAPCQCTKRRRGHPLRPYLLLQLMQEHRQLDLARQHSRVLRQRDKLTQLRAQLPERGSRRRQERGRSRQRSDSPQADQQVLGGAKSRQRGQEAGLRLRALPPLRQGLAEQSLGPGRPFLVVRLAEARLRLAGEMFGAVY